MGPGPAQAPQVTEITTGEATHNPIYCSVSRSLHLCILGSAAPCVCPTMVQPGVTCGQTSVSQIPRCWTCWKAARYVSLFLFMSRPMYYEMYSATTVQSLKPEVPIAGLGHLDHSSHRTWAHTSPNVQHNSLLPSHGRRVSVMSEWELDSQGTQRLDPPLHTYSLFVHSYILGRCIWAL